MRCLKPTLLLLGLTVTALTQLHACPDEECLKQLGVWIPTSIKFPGAAHAYQLRGDYLMCVNDARHAIVVDLKHGKTFDLGEFKNRRVHDGDVAHGQALILAQDRLQAIALETSKTVHDIPIGTQPVYGYGFAGKGQAFVHRGKTLVILDLATGKSVHSIDLGETDDIRRGWTPWQKVGKRLYIVGPATTLCAIDLDTGKLCDRWSVEARHGIAALHIEGSIAYCIGSSSAEFTWVRPLDHLTCLDMERKKSFHISLDKGFRSFSRFGSGPYGTVYVSHEYRVDRFTMSGERCGTFTTPKGEQVLAMWQGRALIAGKGEIRLLEINETPVVKK